MLTQLLNHKGKHSPPKFASLKSSFCCWLKKLTEFQVLVKKKVNSKLGMCSYSNVFFSGQVILQLITKKLENNTELVESILQVCITHLKLKLQRANF
jgi:hypothetical protein